MKAIGVIELKSTKTKNLESIKEQAFGYKNNQPDCKYVITSNFQSLRFYVDNATEYEEFNLFQLNKEQFKLLYLLLSQESIFSGLPEKLKQETKFHENEISTQLYADYKHFKDKIFENLVKNNPQYDKLTLFKKSQKLLDRFLFVFFSEDCGLIPPNAISKIIDQWKVFIEEDEYFTLYSRFQKLFTHLDKGHTYKKWSKIPAYNGGLFQKDEILDSPDLKIDDEILEKDSLKLSAYDFNTEVDVNILGHIFEHSLNEIEARGHAPLIRKKDGIFYTPKYITKYIVENTVGTLCIEQKDKLQINNLLIDENFRKQDGKLNQKGKQLYETLHNYKKWLLTLKILDPACGSGAFLNQTLEFLIAEHKQFDDLLGELTGDNLRLFDTDKAILENNIYGVDINEESVEIAKLSLWLRTAQKGRQLSDLSGNIKCGNSLIDEPEIAGEKAFVWGKEFPQIFQKKEKTAWHITTATHNSRYSQRMYDNYVKRGEPVWLSAKEEKIVSETLAEIVKADKLNISAYNICGDHMHILLVCEEKEIPKIVGKIKSMTARACNIAMERTIPTTRGHAPLRGKTHAPLRGKTQASLWTQKFDRKKITDNEQYSNTLNYIRNNRTKHELSPNKKLHKIINGFVCTTKHAFRKEYNGGFDVVVGNPPYVRADTENDFFIKQRKYLDNSPDYETLYEKWDLMIAFYERSIKLLNINGMHGYIVSNSVTTSKYALRLQEWILKNKNIISLNYFENIEVFKKVGVIPVITIIKNQQPNLNFKKVIHKNTFENISIIKQNFKSKSEITPIKIFKKYYRDNTIKIANILLKDICYMSVGMVINAHEKIAKGEFAKDDLISFVKTEINNKEFVEGKDLKRYKFDRIKFLEWNTDRVPSKLRRQTFPELYIGNKILQGRVTEGVFDNTGIVCNDGVIVFKLFKDLENINQRSINISIKKNNKKARRELEHISVEFDLKYLLSIINSKFANNFLNNIRRHRLKNYFYPDDFRKLPIAKIGKKHQLPFIEKADLMLSLNKKQQIKLQHFQNEMLSDGKIEKLTKKLTNFYELTFDEFIKEYAKKAKISIKNKKDKSNLSKDWREYFEDEKIEINNIQNLINQTDNEIDKIVYELYELTDEEIEIVENSIK